MRYLESRLIELIKDAGRANISNGTGPGAKGLPEFDVADMEFFLEQVQVILPVVGFDFLRPKPTVPVEEPLVRVRDGAQDAIQLLLKSTVNNADARGIYLDGELTVQAGSIVSTKEFVLNLYDGLRKQLIAEKRIVPSQDPSVLKFAEDVAFSSPSAASSVVLNRNSNGRTEWKLMDGRTLKDWQDAQLEPVAEDQSDDAGDQSDDKATPVGTTSNCAE